MAHLILENSKGEASCQIPSILSSFSQAYNIRSWKPTLKCISFGSYGSQAKLIGIRILIRKR